MRWKNVETPTHAGSAGSADKPAYVESMTLYDRDNNVVATFTKDVTGTKSLEVGGVKVYRALLTQTSTNAPVATVLENSLGFVPEWIYDDIGSYHCVNPATPSSNNNFPIGKTFFTIAQGYGALRGLDTNFYSVEIFTYTLANVLVDDALGHTAFEILVYP